MSAPTRYPPTVIFEKVHLKDVTEAVSAAAAAAGDDATDGAAPYTPQASTGQKSAETVRVEAVNIKKFIERGFQEPDMLRRLRVVNEKAYPWRTIGKVVVGQGPITNVLLTGSGVLVGKNLILTTSHVVPWGRENWWMTFTPAFNSGATPFGFSFVERCRGYQQDGELATPLGKYIGWMGSHSYGSESDYYNGVWASVGYPVEPANLGAQFMIVEDNVKIVYVDDEGSEGKELETNLYSLDGWSGGPLWAFLAAGPRVIGIMSGDVTDFLQPSHTLSAGGSPVVKLVKYGMANWS